METTADSDGTKYTRDEDMVLRVKGVIAAVGSKILLAIFDNIFMRIYLTPSTASIVHHIALRELG